MAKKKNTDAVTAAPTPAKVPRARRTRTAAAVERSRPEEIVVGRHYHAKNERGEHFGEATGAGADSISLTSPKGVVSNVKLSSFDVREISREHAHELQQLADHS